MPQLPALLPRLQAKQPSSRTLRVSPVAPPPPRPVQDLRSVAWRISGVVADALRMEGNNSLRQIVAHVPWGYQRI